MNARERLIWNELDKLGTTAIANGWPDFLCFRGPQFSRHIFCVEVKSKRLRPSKQQEQMHEILQSIGIHVLIVSPDRPGWKQKLKAVGRHELSLTCREREEVLRASRLKQETIESFKAENLYLRRIIRALAQRLPPGDPDRYFGFTELYRIGAGSPYHEFYFAGQTPTATSNSVSDARERIIEE